MPDSVTIDINIAMDAIDERRERHRSALHLLQLADEGLVDIAVAPQGYRADLDLPGPVRDQVEHLLKSHGIPFLPQVARVSAVTYPSETLFPGAFSESLISAWDTVIATWETHRSRKPEVPDRWHVETHLVAGRSLLLTNDEPLVRMCQRLEAEHGLPIRAMNVEDYMKQRGTRPT